MFELEEARRECGLSLEEFEALPGDPQWTRNGFSKSDLLAYQRLVKMISAVEHEAQMEDLKRST